MKCLVTHVRCVCVCVCVCVCACVRACVRALRAFFLYALNFEDLSIQRMCKRLVPVRIRRSKYPPLSFWAERKDYKSRHVPKWSRCCTRYVVVHCSGWSGQH